MWLGQVWCNCKAFPCSQAIQHSQWISGTCLSFPTSIVDIIDAMSTICWIFDSLWVRLLEVIPPFDHFAGCTKAYMCDHLSRVFPDAWQASKKLSITTTPEADLKFVRAVLTLYQNATPARQDLDGFGWIWMGDSEDVRSSQSTSIQQPTTNYPIYPTTTTNNQFIQQPNVLVSIAKNVGFPMSPPPFLPLGGLKKVADGLADVGKISLGV